MERFSRQRAVVSYSVAVVFAPHGEITNSYYLSNEMQRIIVGKEVLVIGILCKEIHPFF